MKTESNKEYSILLLLAGTLLLGFSMGKWLFPLAVFRAIENGMSIVRQVYGGLSIATDPYGRVLAQTDFFSSTDRTMVAQVPTKHVTTIYSLFGHYFEWVCLVGFLALTARAVFTKRLA